jgi:hypothetical protein
MATGSSGVKQTGNSATSLVQHLRQSSAAATSVPLKGVITNGVSTTAGNEGPG